MPKEALKFKSQFRQQLLRSDVVRACGCKHTLQPQFSSSVTQNGNRSLIGDTLSPVLGNERESEIRTIQILSLRQSTDAKRVRRFPGLNEAESEAKALIHCHWALQDVGLRILTRSYAPVADEAQPGGLIQKRQDEFGIRSGHAANDEPVCHECFQCVGVMLSAGWLASWRSSQAGNDGMPPDRTGILQLALRLGGGLGGAGGCTDWSGDYRSRLRARCLLIDC